MKQILTTFAVLALLDKASAIRVSRDPLATWAPTVKASPHPLDYAVANFGQDKEIGETFKSLSGSEKEHNHVLNVATGPPPKGPPMDYPVANFGADGDVNITHKNLEAAEKALNH